MSDKTEEKTPDTVQELLHHVQRHLKAPKNQHNSFGGYKYRNCEDIMEAVKPFLIDDAVVLIDDEPVLIGDRYYIKATAGISFKGKTISAKAFAREPLTKKGMDESQITGATSSYARKYALNGLFLIDDTKDADADEKKKDEAEKPVEQTPEEIKAEKVRDWLSKASKELKALKTYAEVIEWTKKNAARSDLSDDQMVWLNDQINKAQDRTAPRKGNSQNLVTYLDA